MTASDDTADAENRSDFTPQYKRVLLKLSGEALMGDGDYGSGFATKAAKLGEAARDALETLGRQALHARLLAFRHPATGEAMRFEAPLPDDMARLARSLRAG